MFTHGGLDVSPQGPIEGISHIYEGPYGGTHSPPSGPVARTPLYKRHLRGTSRLVFLYNWRRFGKATSAVVRLLDFP